MTKARSNSIAANAKGDLVAGSGSAAASVLGIGANDTVLTADSSTATGLKWATPSSGGMTLISTTTLSGSSVTLSSVPQTYTNLYAVIVGLYGSDQEQMAIRFNGDGNSRYTGGYTYAASSSNSVDDNCLNFTSYYNTSAANFQTAMQITIPRYTDTSGNQLVAFNGIAGLYRAGASGGGIYRKSAEITSVTFLARAGTFTAGTLYFYGVK